MNNEYEERKCREAVEKLRNAVHTRGGWWTSFAYEVIAQAMADARTHALEEVDLAAEFARERASSRAQALEEAERRVYSELEYRHAECAEIASDSIRALKGKP